MESQLENECRLAWSDLLSGPPWISREGIAFSTFRLNVIGVYYRVLNRIKLLVTLCLKSHLTLNNDLHALSHSAALKIRQKIYFINLRTTSRAAIFLELWEPLNYFLITPLRKTNIGMLCMQEFFFGGGGSLETL